MSSPYDQERDTGDVDYFGFSAWVLFACAGQGWFELWQEIRCLKETEHPVDANDRPV